MNTAVKKIPNIALTACDSSQIHAHGHCPVTNTLALQFKRVNPADPKGPKLGGAKYHYANFTGDDYAKFLAAESKGTHLGLHIKGAKHDDGSLKFPHTKLDEEQAAA